MLSKMNEVYYDAVDWQELLKGKERHMTELLQRIDNNWLKKETIELRS